MSFSWIKFAIAEVLLVILPVWVIRLAPLNITTKLFLTVAGTAMCWYAITYGGSKRGILSK